MKKGFTLIELLAVIIVLAVIALIAVPIVSNITSEARENSAKISVENYINEVNNTLAYNQIKEIKVPDGIYTVEQLKDYGVTMKGNLPSGNVTIESNKVKNFSLLENGFIITEQDGNILVTKYSDFKVSDYVYFVPDLEEYQYSSNRTINPNELTLYRIISKNIDGSYDAVSEYVSTTGIQLGGKGGYLNSVGILNNYANAYNNESITISARCPGYTNQTLFIDDNENFVSSISTLPNTEKETYEMYGGGDYSSWVNDMNLIRDVYQTYVTTTIDGETNKDYWIASRSFTNSSGRIKRTLGDTLNDGMYEIYLPSGEGWYELSIRPIVTIKPTVLYTSGTGTKTNPYIIY